MSKRVRLEGYPLIAPKGWFNVDDYLRHGELVVDNHAVTCDFCGEAERLVEDKENWPKVEKLLEATIEF